MSTLTAEQLTKFYGQTIYSFNQNNPFRPREMNIPILIARQNSDFLQSLLNNLHNGHIKKELSKEDYKAIAPVLLHESLFHFYKAFYNYLAARKLYSGGMRSWIDISLYYARFYLARSITTLVGQQSYAVNRFRESYLLDPEDKHHIPNNQFKEEIAEALGGKKPTNVYRICLQTNIAEKRGVLKFDKEGISSHDDVWNEYGDLNFDGLGIFSLSYLSKDYQKHERIKENYSFDGYNQLDFNLGVENFRQYFERDYLKRSEDQIYDMTSGDVLLGLSTQFNLYRRLNVVNLPIESEKFLYMIQYCLPNSVAGANLAKLCEEGFPTRNLYSNDGDNFYDDRNEFL